MKFAPALLALLTLSWPLPPQAEESGDAWRFGGDLRLSGVWDRRSGRDDSRNESSAARARLRTFAEWSISDRLSFRARIAGRYGSDQDGASAYVTAAAPTRNGAALGDSTFDEFHLRLAPVGAPWSLRLGRFQSGFVLQTLQGKSLDRNDGPNTDIHWTDGLHWQYQLAPKLIAHAILQHLPDGGPGSTHRAPLDFSADGSRWGGYFALESRNAIGPLIQRGIGLTVYPDSLAVDGLASPRRADYRALSARATAAWPLGNNGMRLLVGGEIGRAERRVAGRSAAAWQTEFDIEGPARRHSSGIVLGSAGGSWLTSSDFRENDRLFEWRYLWRLRADFSLDARWRWRREIDTPASADQARVDRDVYVRVTWKF
jgi:hypothetical protein